MNLQMTQSLNLSTHLQFGRARAGVCLQKRCWFTFSLSGTSWLFYAKSYFCISYKIQELIISKNIEILMKQVRNKNSRRIQQLIKRSYDEQKQSLYLYSQSDWKQVILDRDWSMLIILQLYECRIDDSGAQLLGLLKWPNLHKIKFDQNRITGVGIEKLLDGSFPSLKQFRIMDNKIGDEGGRILATNKNMCGIKVLSIINNKVTNLGLVSMPKLKMSCLEQLWIDSNKIGCKGAQLLIKAEFPLLQLLHIGSCQIGNEGLTHLAKGNWPRMKSLRVDGNKANFDGAIVNSNWKQLQSLQISQPNDRIQYIWHFGLIANNWGTNLRIYSCGFDNSQLRQDIDEIINQRFSLL